VLCSDRAKRISITDTASRTIVPLASQRVLMSGFSRKCSDASAPVSRTIAPHSAQPIHSASNHQSMRPSDSAAHSNAMPGANIARVTKSRFSNTLMRSLGGRRSISTQPSASSAIPTSNWYSLRQSPNSSRPAEKMRASGSASCATPIPTTSPRSRCAAGKACIV